MPQCRFKNVRGVQLKWIFHFFYSIQCPFFSTNWVFSGVPGAHMHWFPESLTPGTCAFLFYPIRHTICSPSFCVLGEQGVSNGHCCKHACYLLYLVYIVYWSPESCKWKNSVFILMFRHIFGTFLIEVVFKKTQISGFFIWQWKGGNSHLHGDIFETKRMKGQHRDLSPSNPELPSPPLLLNPPSNRTGSKLRTPNQGIFKGNTQSSP